MYYTIIGEVLCHFSVIITITLPTVKHGAQLIQSIARAFEVAPL
jgi:hypothetical protein